MKLTGEATLRAPVPEVYAALVDPAVLVRTIPGCERLELVGTDHYRAVVTAGVASVKGTFDGDVRLADQRSPHSFTLHATGAGAPGTVSAVARVALVDGEDGATLLRYDADATFGGMVGGVGQRMLAGVARKTAAEFFAAVERELAGVGAPAPAPVALPAGAEVPAGGRVAGAGAPLPAGAPTATAPVGAVWTAPAPPLDLARQRRRDLLTGAVFGAVVALLGVLVGALVAGW